MKTIVSVKGSGFFFGFSSRCHQRGHNRLCPPTECTSNDGWHRLQLPPLCMLPINSILGLCVALWNIPILIGDFMYLFTNWVCRSILSLLNCSKKANKSVKENTHIAYDTLFFFIRMLFSRVRLNILIFPQILGFKYSCIILNNS